MDPNISEQINLKTFSTETQLNWISNIMRQELAQPYSLFTYTNFLTSWPDLAVMAYHKDKIVGTIIGSYDSTNPKKAYIAMLVVEKEYRRCKVGKKLFQEFYSRVKKAGATKIVLQTQCINSAALRFYLSLGFFKTRKMLNYYQSGNDAFRLKLYIPQNEVKQEKIMKQKKQGKQMKQQKKVQTNKEQDKKTEIGSQDANNSKKQ